ncbi:hypothetical protein ABIF53_000248, partial [Bradyrhizobium japonicum]
NTLAGKGKVRIHHFHEASTSSLSRAINSQTG